MHAGTAGTVAIIEHIGIVACSAEGAALCYQEIARAGLDLVGKHDHPRVTMDSIAMAQWMPAFDAGDLDALAAIILDSTAVVAAAGAGFAICPDNSAHIAWDQVQAATPIPWLHIAEVVGTEARRIGATRIGVLGTRFTMGGPVYPQVLGGLGLDCVVPDDADAALVDRIIFDELVNGVLRRREPPRLPTGDRPPRGPRLRRRRPRLHRDPAADQPRPLVAADPRLDPPPGPRRGRAGGQIALSVTASGRDSSQKGFWARNRLRSATVSRPEHSERVAYGRINIRRSHSSSGTRRPLAAITMLGTRPSRKPIVWPARPTPQRRVPSTFHQWKRPASYVPPAPS